MIFLKIQNNILFLNWHARTHTHTLPPCMYHTSTERGRIHKEPHYCNKTVSDAYIQNEELNIEFCTIFKCNVDVAATVSFVVDLHMVLGWTRVFIGFVSIWKSLLLNIKLNDEDISFPCVILAVKRIKRCTGAIVVHSLHNPPINACISIIVLPRYHLIWRSRPIRWSLHPAQNALCGLFKH